MLQFPCLETPRDLWVTNKDLHDGTLRARTVHNKMYVLAKALKNSGYDIWPNIGIMKIGTSQVFEDGIFTCTVSDGLSSDSETFPVSVVNYPVANLPPLIEDLKDQHVEVGKGGAYHITVYDPDPEDMSGLTFKATIAEYESYRYGAWCWCYYDTIDQNGTIKYMYPYYIGDELNYFVIVSDPRGMYAIAAFTVYFHNPPAGTWLNQSPIITRPISSPQKVRAGSLFILNELHIEDPDHEPLYYSCNQGSIGDGGIYSFLPFFPGEYTITISAFDVRGQKATQEFILEVLPWWSY